MQAKRSKISTMLIGWIILVLIFVSNLFAQVAERPIHLQPGFW